MTTNYTGVIVIYHRPTEVGPAYLNLLFAYLHLLFAYLHLLFSYLNLLFKYAKLLVKLPFYTI